MGQYYKACVLKQNKTTIDKWVYSHDIKHSFKNSNGQIIEVGNGLKLMEHSYLKNDFVRAFESLIFENPQSVVWGGDYANTCKGLKTNLYERCNDKTKVIPENRIGLRQGRYILNMSKKMFVDKYKIPSFKNGWKLHPLPLLTCEGNRQGGGDFWSKDDNNIVGSWARDFISVQGTKPKGFTELVFDLIED